MQQTILNQAIIRQARLLLTTPFLHQGRSPMVGLDCLGLLVAIANNLQLRDKYGELLSSHDRCDYNKCPDGDALHASLSAALLSIERPYMQEGDILLFSLEGNPQHLGIVSDYHVGGLGLIHAYAPTRSVVEHALDDTWKKRMIAIFRVPASTQTFQIGSF